MKVDNNRSSSQPHHQRCQRRRRCCGHCHRTDGSVGGWCRRQCACHQWRLIGGYDRYGQVKRTGCAMYCLLPCQCCTDDVVQFGCGIPGTLFALAAMALIIAYSVIYFQVLDVEINRSCNTTSIGVTQGKCAGKTNDQCYTSFRRLDYITSLGVHGENTYAIDWCKISQSGCTIPILTQQGEACCLSQMIDCYVYPNGDWYGVSDPQITVFNLMVAMIVMTFISGWLCISCGWALYGFRHALEHDWRTADDEEQRNVRIAWLSGLHPDMGSKSALYHSFAMNECYDPQILPLIADFMDGGDRVKILDDPHHPMVVNVSPESSHRRTGDRGRVRFHHQDEDIDDDDDDDHSSESSDEDRRRKQTKNKKKAKTKAKKKKRSPPPTPPATIVPTIVPLPTITIINVPTTTATTNNAESSNGTPNNNTHANGQRSARVVPLDVESSAK